MDKPVYVVTKRDGKPLSEKDDPFQVVVPGEKRAAMWVRQMTALKIQQAIEVLEAAVIVWDAPILLAGADVFLGILWAAVGHSSGIPTQ